MNDKFVHVGSIEELKGYAEQAQAGSIGGALGANQQQGIIYNPPTLTTLRDKLNNRKFILQSQISNLTNQFDDITKSLEVLDSHPEIESAINILNKVQGLH